jgi:hypothetical protein
MNKTKLYGWIIVLLVALNLTTIGTVVVHHLQHKQEQKTLILDPENNIRINGRYFRQELGFDNEQLQVFRVVNRTFQPEARAILEHIDSLKEKAFEELHGEHPDTVVLNKLAQEIGHQHGNLKYKTHHFYLTLKNTCNEEQAIKLQELFSPLFRDGSCSPMGNKQRYNNRTDQ